MSDIWKRRLELDKEIRVLKDELFKPYRELYNNKRRQLIEECEKEGHNFKFSHIGPIGNPWFYCSKCGTSKVEEA